MTPRFKLYALLAVALAYAILRYPVLGDTPWANVPLFVLNKALSWAGLVVFGMSLVSREKALRRYYGVRATALLAVHILLSLLVLNPAYFPRFYAETGRLTATAELSMLAGVLGAALLGGLFYLNGQGQKAVGRSLRAGWGRAILWCGALHVAAMGYAVWLAPETWPGYLPPISLLSLVAAAWYLHRRSRQAA